MNTPLYLWLTIVLPFTIVPYAANIAAAQDDPALLRSKKTGTAVYGENFERLVQNSDAVVIAVPVGFREVRPNILYDSKLAELVSRVKAYAVACEVRTALKGRPANDMLDLIEIDGNLAKVSVTRLREVLSERLHEKGAINERPVYLMFLRKNEDNTYRPTSGLFDASASVFRISSELYLDE